jgi:hypothetical protein
VTSRVSPTHAIFVGDYKIGEALLGHSAMALHFCLAPPPDTTTRPESPPLLSNLSKLSLPTLSRPDRSRTPSPEPTLAVLPTPPQPRRLVVLVVGIKPHRAGMWTSSHRPGESVIEYILLGGAPALILPAALGAPLISWFTQTLEQLWTLSVPKEDTTAVAATGEQMAKEGGKDAAKANTFAGVLASLSEYVSMCVDWERVEVPGAPNVDEGAKRKAMREALALVLAAAVRSGESKKVRKETDADRAGVAVWRIP